MGVEMAYRTKRLPIVVDADEWDALLELERRVRAHNFWFGETLDQIDTIRAEREGLGPKKCPNCVGRPHPDLTPYFVLAEGPHAGKCPQCLGAGIVGPHQRA